MEPRLIILPVSDFLSSGKAAREILNIEVTFTAIVRSQMSSPSSSTVLGREIPALFTRTSNPPIDFNALEMMNSGAFWSVISISIGVMLGFSL